MDVIRNIINRTTSCVYLIPESKCVQSERLLFPSTCMRVAVSWDTVWPPGQSYQLRQSIRGSLLGATCVAKSYKFNLILYVIHLAIGHSGLLVYHECQEQGMYMCMYFHFHDCLFAIFTFCDILPENFGQGIIVLICLEIVNA